MADNAHVEMLPSGLDSIVRMVHRADHDRVTWIVTATHQTLCRLKAKRDTSKAVTKVPAGSDQADLGSLKEWLDRITPADKAAIAQVQVIDATAFARS